MNEYTVLTIDEQGEMVTLKCTFKNEDELQNYLDREGSTLLMVSEVIEHTANDLFP